MAKRQKRGSCEYFKDYFNNRDPLDEPIAPIGEVIRSRQFGIIANNQNVKFNNKNCSQQKPCFHDCLPQKRCFSLWLFDNKSKGIGNVAFFDYLDEDTRTIIFKSYEEICSKICKSVHSITTETYVDTKNYSIVYSMIAENEKLNRNDPYIIGTDVFTIDEYKKFVDENKNKKPTEMPRLELFVNMDNFVESELSYTEWLKTQPNALPKTDPLPTVELPKTDPLPTVELPKTDAKSGGELPKTDALPTGDDEDDDEPPGYYDLNYTTGPLPTTVDDGPPPAYGGAKSRKNKKERKNKSRRCRKSKRRNNKKRRQHTRRQ